MHDADPIAAPLKRAMDCSYRWAMAAHRYGATRRAHEVASPGSRPGNFQVVNRADGVAMLARRDFVLALGSLTEVAPELAALLMDQGTSLAIKAGEIGAGFGERDPRGYVVAAHAVADLDDDRRSA